MVQSGHYLQTKAVLKQRGLKVTPARLAILNIFEHTKRPLSIRGIAQKLKPNTPDLVTVYRTVESLIKVGVVKEIMFSSSSAYYELTKLDHHHHLLCRSCGLVKSIKICSVSELQTQLLKSSKFGKIEYHSLEFFGLCKKCLKNNQ